MAIPEEISLATVKRAATDLISTTTYDAEGDFELLEPERLLHTLPKAEAEARLRALRDFERYGPPDRSVQ